MNSFELFNEIKNDEVDNVKQVLHKHPKLINEYLYGVTPFLYSIECGSNNVALYLSQNSDVDIELKDNTEETCLEKAIEKKMGKIVEFICKKYPKKFVKNSFMQNGETLLTNCLKMHDQDISVALIKGGFDTNIANKLKEYPIELAIKFNQTIVVDTMLQLNQTFLGTLETNYNPLLDACEKDLTDLAILLIRNGTSDLNITDKAQGWSPLMYAITNNNETLVGKLIDNKCSISDVDNEGNSPLHLAVLNENEYLIRLLLKSNPNKSIRNTENQTAYDLAKVVDEDIAMILR